MPDSRESVDPAELSEALADYIDKANASPRAAKALAGWNCRIHIRPADLPGTAFTLPRKTNIDTASRRMMSSGPALRGDRALHVVRHRGSRRPGRSPRGPQ